jgi:hypothetical protein
MDAYPDVRQLQQETKRKGQAIDKMVNPPMIADTQLKNQPASMIPGGITYVNSFGKERPGFAPVYTVNPQIREMMEDILVVQNRVKDTFFNNIFLAITNLSTVRSATEIDARRSEQMVMLGPVLERIYDEGIKPAIERTFGIMSRVPGLLPPPPPEMAGMDMQIEFESMLQNAQNAASSSGIERLLGLAGNLAAVDPAVMDNIDIDFALDKYSDNLNNDPRLIRSPKQLTLIRQQREQEKQQQAMQQQSLAAVQGAKVLSETPMGNGQSALQQVTGGGM